MAEIELPDPEELTEVKGNRFTKRVALVTAFYAVVLAITSLGGNNAMKEMILAQQQASDQWAFYQAKTIREALYRNERTRLELDIMAGAGSLSAEARSAFEAAAKKLREEEARFGNERKEIEKTARALEEERDINRSKDPYFDYGEVLLQIAIVLASIAIVSTSPPVFWFSAAAAALGAAFSINGFLLIFRVPFFH